MAKNIRGKRKSTVTWRTKFQTRTHHHNPLKFAIHYESQLFAIHYESQLFRYSMLLNVCSPETLTFKELVVFGQFPSSYQICNAG